MSDIEISNVQWTELGDILARIEALEGGVPSWLPDDVMRRLQDAEGAVKRLEAEAAISAGLRVRVAELEAQVRELRDKVAEFDGHSHLNPDRWRVEDLEKIADKVNPEAPRERCEFETMGFRCNLAAGHRTAHDTAVIRHD
jgi:hypothetical protein